MQAYSCGWQRLAISALEDCVEIAVGPIPYFPAPANLTASDDEGGCSCPVGAAYSGMRNSLEEESACVSRDTGAGLPSVYAYSCNCCRAAEVASLLVSPFPYPLLSLLSFFTPAGLPLSPAIRHTALTRPLPQMGQPLPLHVALCLAFLRTLRPPRFGNSSRSALHRATLVSQLRNRHASPVSGPGGDDV
jgi:hypothetical protein